MHYPYDHLVLATKRNIFVRPTEGGAKWPPLDQTSRGSLDIMLEDDFAASLLKCGPAEADSMCVKLLKLKWDFRPGHAGIDEYVCQGIDFDVAPIVVKATDAKPKRERRPAPDADDFLADMMADLRQESRRQARGAQHVVDAAHEQHAALASALEDLFSVEAVGEELRAFVERNDQDMEAEDREVAGEEEEEEGKEGPDASAEDKDKAEDELVHAPAVDEFVNMREHPPNSSRFIGKEDGARIGRIHFIGTNAKATCNRHAKCVCYVTTPAGVPVAQVVGDLTNWLDSFVSSAEHADQARAIKRDKYHMKVRT